MMKSVKLQLLVTLAAVATVVGVFAIRGLPPEMSISDGAKTGDVGSVRRSIHWGVDVNARALYGNTPLHWTFDKDVTEVLIAGGADVNARNDRGITPLHSAIVYETVRLLMAKRADVNVKDDRDMTPLHGTIQYEMTRLLIAKGADVNAKNNDGRTPLHLVTYDKDAAAMLVAKGADINAKDNDGRTPLMIAIKYGYNEVAALLRRHGARE